MSRDVYRHAILLPCIKFHWSRTIGCWVMAKKRFLVWRPSTILNFSRPIMGSLKTPCRTSYRSSIETIALNCLVFEKITFLCTHFGGRQTHIQTDERTDGQNWCERRSRYRERRHNAATKLTAYSSGTGIPCYVRDLGVFEIDCTR